MDHLEHSPDVVVHTLAVAMVVFQKQESATKYQRLIFILIAM